ncbi:MAG: tRNA (N6-threonylcarbamoyladenosine(37)-N6)-methyltransferase TrmO [Clostridia bacterium]|nr:tRNA (N6-threonylcarbamoyladenosine(37)-N6)-methyltransferase TrmO [Clostridia bacterium]
MNELSVIARVRTDFPSKFGLPRQSGLVPGLEGLVVFEKAFRNPDALRGIEGYSHLWLLWGFSQAFASGAGNGAWSPTVRPPRLGGNTRVGVFATRSPNRPNPIGLSAVRLLGVENDPKLGATLRISGIDMADNTPVYDIKPYLPLSDCIPDALGGFSDAVKNDSLQVVIDEALLEKIPENRRGALRSLLAADPRPAYLVDGGREYGFPWAGYEISFCVSDGTLTVTGIEKRNEFRQETG